MLVTPLRHQGTALGVLKVYSSCVAAFDGTAGETLQLLVGIISASMHRAATADSLLHVADTRMYAGKRARREM